VISEKKSEIIVYKEYASMSLVNEQKAIVSIIIHITTVLFVEHWQG
jgi:hypothetical protein